MLLQDFYKIISIRNDETQKHSISITVNKDHKIFNGHFPENPVVPGVCMLQITKELVEKITGESLFLQKVINAKFTALINPEVNPGLVLELDIIKIDENQIKVKNATYFNETLALKLIGVYKIIVP